jgi:outer membrane autotransporter protein
VRFGKTETDFTSNLLDPAGTTARYDSDANYIGAHFGFGYVKNLNEAADLDIYTKLLWTRQGSDSITTSTGDPVEFDSTDSLRWKTGLRYGRLARDDKFRWYIGAAYEHEFGGDADATAYGGYAIDAPSLGGGTGIGEIGFTYKKSPTDPFSLDLNISGYVGQREGVSGRLEMNWIF